MASPSSDKSGGYAMERIADAHGLLRVQAPPSPDDLALCPLCKHRWSGHFPDRAVDAVHCGGRNADGQDCDCIRSTVDRPRVFIRYVQGPTGMLWRVAVGLTLRQSQQWLTFSSWDSAIRSVDFVLRH